MSVGGSHNGPEATRGTRLLEYTEAGEPVVVRQRLVGRGVLARELRPLKVDGHPVDAAHVVPVDREHHDEFEELQ